MRHRLICPALHFVIVVNTITWFYSYLKSNGLFSKTKVATFKHAMKLTASSRFLFENPSSDH